MSEFKGTKGIWKTKKDENSNGWIGVETDNNELSVTVYPNKVSDKRGTFSIETQSNALLISKAPELLEMLKDVEDLLEAYPSESEMHLKASEIRNLIKEATEL